MIKKLVEKESEHFDVKHQKGTVAKQAKGRKIMITVLISLLISVVIYFTIALTLIFTDSPVVKSNRSGGISFTEAIDADYADIPELISYTARDGESLDYRRYDGGTERLIILVHGSGWHGMQFHSMASEFASMGLGTVIVPDLRGHGVNPERRGDLDYIGQFEDDLEDLIQMMMNEHAYHKVVLGGHSSGAGLVVRFAGGQYNESVDAYILMAPFLKYNAPTTKVNSGGWAYPATRRIAGLSMLNNVGITALNNLPVIRFAMADEVLEGPYGATATTSYSYRLNTAFAPRMNYKKDLASMQVPFLLIAGLEDEAFNVHEYEPLISEVTDSGEYHLLDGINHIGVTIDAKAIKAIADWIQAH